MQTVDDIRAERQRHIDALNARHHEEDLKLADYIESHPASLVDAKAFVKRFLGSDRHSRYHWILQEWRRILETKSAHEIAAIFRDGSETTDELRSSAPFCGPALEAL